MLAATLSFPCYAKPTRLTIRNSLTNFSNRNSLKLRASLFDYPLASRIMVRISSGFRSLPSAIKHLEHVVCIMDEDLPYSTNESSLRQEFSNFGEIAEVKLENNGARKWSKGYAFIQYTCQEDAMLALENMDYKKFDGRVIYVELAKPGGNAFGGCPKTSGPPKVQHLQEQDEVPDCWY